MIGAEKRAWLQERAEGDEIELILFDGLDDAIVGLAYTHTLPARVAYSYERILDILSQDMSRLEAEEYFDFNIGCLWAGENTPTIVFEPEGY